MSRRLDVRVETWPVAGHFTIARGSRREVMVVVVEIREDHARGRGECVPYARYGQSVEGVVAALRARDDDVRGGLDRASLQDLLPPGPARNALDCALWDLEAKHSDTPVWKAAGLAEPGPLLTAYTISLAEPDAMARAAARASSRPLLKVKLGADGDDDRIAAVREAAPDARLIVDANEGWSLETLERLVPVLAAQRVELVEQPLPVALDAALEGRDLPIPLCADESCHDADSLAALAGRYAFANLKLDKTGGLTGALRLVERARDLGLELMLGCMVGTSLSMAPAVLLGGLARFVDLDGPLLLARDRTPGLRYDGSTIAPPLRELWG